MLIFAQKKSDVDAMHEYLLLKGVEAVSIHGGKGEIYIPRLPIAPVFMHIGNEAILWTSNR